MAKFSVNLQWSQEDKAYIATVPELPGLNAFGDTAKEALQELTVAQELYLEVMEEDGEQIPEPNLYKSFSGQTRLRLPKSLHASLSDEATGEGVSLNTYIVQLLSERNAFNKVKDVFSQMENRVYKVLLQNYPTAEPDTDAESGLAIFTHIMESWGERGI